jgi:hypothetical protein
VLGAVELRAAQPRSERVARSSIAFVPERRALAVLTRRAAGARGDAGAADDAAPIPNLSVA